MGQGKDTSVTPAVTEVSPHPLSLSTQVHWFRKAELRLALQLWKKKQLANPCTAPLDLCKRGGHRAASSVPAVIFVPVPSCQLVPGNTPEASESKAKRGIMNKAKVSHTEPLGGSLLL